MNKESNTLIRLMIAMTNGRPKSSRDLAQEFRMDEATVREMLTRLAERGYLRRNTPTCDGACNACPLRQVCAITPAIWVLSDKGHRAVIAVGHA
ncbi:MAG: helix-turn-helix domain-containing protein [Anaerolineae bacterium]|nr:helix-turn-helix domain-containing protein [Anaerolineae bacterium]